MLLLLRRLDNLKLTRSRDANWFCFTCYVIEICLLSNLASVYQEPRLPCANAKVIPIRPGGWGGGAESARADFNFKNFRDIYAIPTECGHFY